MKFSPPLHHTFTSPPPITHFTTSMSTKFESNTHRKRAKTPSFSSILLDAIYRSFDEDHHHHHHDGDYPRTTPTSPIHSIVNQMDCEINNASNSKLRRTKMRSDCTLETVDLRRAIMIESWMDRPQPQSQQQLLLQQLPQFQQRNHFHLGDALDQKVRIVRQKSVPNCASAPDNSSSNNNDEDLLSSCFTNLAPRSSSRDQSSSRIFTKTKSRALKIYGDLKRTKQPNAPISPGRRIAAFLNSIFRNSAGSPARSSPEIKLNPPATTTSDSTCSSASSFSRSCLSNKTSSSGKSTTKRSVRFYPVSVIVDEDSRPCGHKSLHKNGDEESKKLLSSPTTADCGGGVEQHRRWRREKEIDALMMMIKTNCSSNNNNHRRHVSSFDEDSDEEMDEDDGDSCASSDLFELENLSSIGGATRYCEELPVYGTTSLKDLTA